MNATPEQRAREARAEIRRYTGEINYHDDEASRLRKERAKHQAKLGRAETAIQRNITATAYERKSA